MQPSMDAVPCTSSEISSHPPGDPPSDEDTPPVVWWTTVMNPISLRFASPRHEANFSHWHAKLSAQTMDWFCLSFSAITFLWFMFKVHSSQSLQDCILVGLQLVPRGTNQSATTTTVCVATRPTAPAAAQHRRPRGPTHVPHLPKPRNVCRAPQPHRRHVTPCSHPDPRVGQHMAGIQAQSSLQLCTNV